MMSLLMSLAQASLPVDAPPIQDCVMAENSSFALHASHMGRFGLDFMSFLVAEQPALGGVLQRRKKPGARLTWRPVEVFQLGPGAKAQSCEPHERRNVAAV
jgi:hypothetical protein